MTKSKRVKFNYIIGNFIPFFQLLVFGLILFSSFPCREKILALLLWTYVLPPLLTRGIYFCFGKPQGSFPEASREFWIWYFTSQLQVVFMRFTFLEEFLRLTPLLYNNWLRLWGAKIGKLVYWSPRSYILDRSYLEIGDQVMIGFYVGFTAHHVNTLKENVELIIASPRVHNNAILGGLSGLSPGAEVGENETLPSTIVLAPFCLWKNGRKHARKE